VQKYALQFRFILKKIELQKVRGIFVKLVDCVGYLVNLASTEYRSITEKVQWVFHKIDGLQNHFNKVQGFFTKFMEYDTITKGSGFFVK